MPWNFGPPTYTCQYCGAILWYEERNKKTKKVSYPKFTFCCMEGRVQIPFMKETPPLLKYLLGADSGQKGSKFRKNIRAYNSMFAFTSMGGRVDASINQSKGPFVFRMSGQNYHHIGSLLPEVGKKPQFAQLYIYDTENETDNRINTLLKHGTKTEIDHEILHELSKMLDQHNNLVKSFRMARDRYKTQPESTFCLRLLNSRTRDGRRYNMPTFSEVTGLIVGDFSEANFQRDVIIEHRTKGLRRITDLHPSFMPMTYPLIYPYGEDGYRPDISLRDVSDASQLWKSNYTTLSEDITSLQRKRFRLKDLQLTKQQVKAYTLLEIETIMLKMGKSLRDIDGMPLPNSSLIRDSGNRLVNEELDYDRDQLKKLHEKSFAALNACQKSAYEAIMHSVENEKGHLFFINGHGGTGKTFLWNTIIAKLRSHSKIVLPVATSGITTWLLPNGRTTHSRFHIPLDVTAESTCEIRQGTLLAGLLIKTSLIIWDEAPMAHKFCFEALDRTLRDILRTRYENSSIKPFRGLTIVCGGDFQQILPVVPKGIRADIVDASLNSSYLWPFFKIYKLKQNMRLYNGSVSGSEAAKIASFDKWLLQIGDGSLYDDIDRDLVKLPSDICKKPSENLMKSIVDTIYPSIRHNYSDPAYLKERAILMPKNKMVHELNEMILNIIPGQGRTFLAQTVYAKQVQTQMMKMFYIQLNF
ncbi:helitron like n domain-containing protein [Citrus sinensis]|nr:helitron like n domain-containing protein [Citrus sinensis]